MYANIKVSCAFLLHKVMPLFVYHQLSVDSPPFMLQYKNHPIFGDQFLYSFDVILI